MDHKFNVINNRFEITLFEDGTCHLRALTTDINDVKCYWRMLDGKLCLDGGITNSLSYAFHASVQRSYENYLKEMVVSE